jgi:hypothetical protein
MLSPSAYERAADGADEMLLGEDEEVRLGRHRQRGTGEDLRGVARVLRLIYCRGRRTMPRFSMRRWMSVDGSRLLGV